MACNQDPGTGISPADASAPTAGDAGTLPDSSVGPPLPDLAVAQGLVVSPDGQGTACTWNAPCALLTGQAAARARAVGMQEDLVVTMLGGNYALAHTWTLDARDSGQNDHFVIYRAALNQYPIISGGAPVTNFAPAMAPPAPMGSWVADVPIGSASRHYFSSTGRAVRARSQGDWSKWTANGSGFVTGPSPAPRLAQPALLEVVALKDWKMFRCGVTAATPAQITMAQPCWGAAAGGTANGFQSAAWIENALELLDRPGEFFLDGAAGKLYYLPLTGEPMPGAKGVLPILEELVHAEGQVGAPIHHLAFEGVGFQHSTWNAPSTSDGYVSLQAGFTFRGNPAALEKPLASVTFRAARNVHLRRCRFAHLGSSALAFDVGAQDNSVEDSRFDDISGSAVLLGDVTHDEDHHPTSPDRLVRDNTLSGNFISRTGVDYFDTAAIFVGYTTRTTLTKNDLFDLPYTGISIGWGWGSVDVGGSARLVTPTSSLAGTITNNHIAYHMRALVDGGGVYTNGAQAGSVLRGNFVENQGNAYGNLYLDNGTQGYTVSQNAVLIAPKEYPAQDPFRTYWVYVQVYPTIASNNVVKGNYSNDDTMLRPMPLDPSNTVEAAMPITPAALGGAQAIVAAAGSAFRTPNLAVGKPVTVSSIYDPTHSGDKAVNGNGYDGWSPTAMDPHPWLQVDLGAEYALDTIELVTRWSFENEVTRRNFVVWGSDNPSFASRSALGAVGSDAVPGRAIWTARVDPPQTFRYVRIEKTAAEYFFVAELLVHGK